MFVVVTTVFQANRCRKTDELSDLTQLARLQKPTDVNELRHGGLLDQVYERCTKLNSNDLDALSRALITTPERVTSWSKWSLFDTWEARLMAISEMEEQMHAALTMGSS